MGARALPCFTGVIGVFIFLQPDARSGEKVHAVRVVPVHVRDQHVSNVFWRKRRLAGRHDSRLADSFRWLNEAINLKCFEELRAIEA